MQIFYKSLNRLVIQVAKKVDLLRSPAIISLTLKQQDKNMQINVAEYKNTKLNSSSTDNTHTRDCVLISSVDGSRLGGVDHYMKKSVKQIVSYYVRRMEREGYDKGTYMVNIVTGEGHFGKTTGTIAIQIEVA